MWQALPVATVDIGNALPDGERTAMQYRSAITRTASLALLGALLAACSRSEAPARQAPSLARAPAVTSPAPAAAPAPTAAVPVDTPLARLLRQLDRDGDGRVSRDEHAGITRTTFDAMDADHDGYVTVAEMDAVRRNLYGDGRSATQIASLDRDHDGRMSLDEHAAATRAGFDQADGDHDGFLTLHELEAAEASARRSR
jgi:hypothetical protein